MHASTFAGVRRRADAWRAHVRSNPCKHAPSASAMALGEGDAYAKSDCAAPCFSLALERVPFLYLTRWASIAVLCSGENIDGSALSFVMKQCSVRWPAFLPHQSQSDLGARQSRPLCAPLQLGQT